MEDSFNHPESLPVNDYERELWQNANKTFWEKQSMRYDWKEAIPFTEFSDEYYKEIDKRFLGATWLIMPWVKMPFEQWMNPMALVNQDVLEIGIGNGTHAQLLSQKAKTFTGIDLTEYAVKSTKKRFKLYGLSGNIHCMDAEELKFPINSFDFVWSWGVIHHSSNTKKILEEIHRVLRPGGKTVIMVYYRSWWSYLIGGLLFGLFKGDFLKGRTLHQINQSKTDGALARYYTFQSWRSLTGNQFNINRLETLGNKGDILPMPGSKLKNKLLKLIPTNLAILFLKNLKMGSFLICEMTKNKS